jgi:Mn-dependent DtxR family transcriptional regulator
VLGVSDSDIVLSSAIALFILIVVVLFYKQLLVTTFDPTLAHIIGISAGAFHYFLMTMLSMSIVAGLQSVGVILIIAMLITPPATAYLLTDKLKLLLVISAACGVISSVAGLYLSYHFNFASGASIVLVAVFIFMVIFLFSPKEGIVMKALRRRKITRLNRYEDIIKILSMEEIPSAAEDAGRALSGKLGFSSSKIRSALRSITKLGLVEQQNGNYRLTEKGNALAKRLVRSHRLWETYLTDKHVVDIENVHEDAEKYEHIISEDLLAELDEELGHPEKDPHGSPIPKKN